MRVPFLLALAGLVVAQSPSAPPAPSQASLPGSVSRSSTFPVSLSLTTSSATITTSTRVGGAVSQFLTVVPTVFNVTLTLTPTATSSSSPTSTGQSASASPSPAPIVLDTRVDPAFGVLGVILILTGLPSAFWGHKNRWTSFFLIGFYTLSLVCAVLIIRFGVIPAINPPSKTLRGMFVLSSVVAGFGGGGIAIFFWKAARYGIGGWGGFALALWIQCFRDGGVIKTVGYRWIFYIALTVVGFTLCTVPKIHHHVLLISTALVGSSAFMLGVDCYTTAGLKEFYIWNLGFRDLFPKFTTNGIEFPVSQTMQIELGLMAAVSLMGSAVQLRILKVLKRKLKEIAEEARRQDEQAELEAANRFADINQEREAWEKEHPSFAKHGRQYSTLSSTPLMKEREQSSSPTTLAEEGRPRYASGLSDFKAAPAPQDDVRRSSRYLQTPVVLPALDLGLGIQDDVPTTFISEVKEKPKLRDLSVQELEELKKKEELVAEIENIRKTIDVLKSDATPSISGHSRRPSMGSRRTLSIDASIALSPPTAHPRPPRETDPRARVHSMEWSTLSGTRSPPLDTVGETISRPTSVPLRDPDWNSYIQERKLLQPPSGVTPPIVPSPVARVPISNAVQEALETRKRKESVLTIMGAGSRSVTPGSMVDGEDVPLAKVVTSGKEKKQSGLGGVTGLGNGGHATASAPKDTSPQVTILPPKRASTGNVLAPIPQRGTSKSPVVKTFEELNERHREKMRDLQGPLTRAEKDNADLRDAKERWERAKKAEREAMLRKQTEEKGRRQHGHARPKEKEGEGPKKQSRSLSADKLGAANTGSKRLSVLKVEDWQKYQANSGTSGNVGGATEMGRRRDSSVPFPGQSSHDRSRSQHRSQRHQRSRSRDYLS